MTQPQTGQPKPLSDLAYWLAVQHQADQQQIADKTAAGLALLWGALQFDRLDETTPAWLHAVTLQVEQQFRESESVAFDFVQGSKWSVEPLSDPLKKVATVFPMKDFQIAMRATGPATVKRATQKAFAAPVGDSAGLAGTVAPEVPRPDVAAVRTDVMALGKLTSTGAAVKQVLNGGRGEVQQLVVIDAKERFKTREPIGWARFTEDSKTGPCYFCALLASQGAVFYSEGSFKQSNNMIREPVAKPRGNNRTMRRAFVGDGPAKVHDHCKCTLRPVYREVDSMDARAKYFLRQWKNMHRDNPWLAKLEGTEDMKLFRKVYKQPPPYSERPAVNLAAMRSNRALVTQALGADSPHSKWWDRQVKALEAAS